ncbi:hypothetical protein EJ07DRAFT_182432 [Lizonia empirigonia]|nr:hypothetical protein EJ07DRAFT_182432 [Lizonia empirigonia]
MALLTDTAQSSSTPASSGVQTIPLSEPCYLSKLFPPPGTVYDTVVQVIVGRDTKQTFQAHKGLLSYFSEYFSRAFGSLHWQEAQDGVVRLEDEAPETFQLFYNWIYTGKVRDDTKVTPQKYIIRDTRKRPVKLVMDGDIVPEISAREISVPFTFTQLYRLAVFADMRVVPALTDTLTSLIMQKALTELRLDVQSNQALTESILHPSKVVSCIGWIITLSVDFKDYKDHYMNLPSPLLQASEKMLASARARPRIEGQA